MKKFILFLGISLMYSALLVYLVHVGIISFGQTIFYNFSITKFGIDFMMYLLLDIGFIVAAYFGCKQYMKNNNNNRNKLYKELKIGYIIVLALYIFAWILSWLNIEIVVYLSLYIPLILFIIGIYTLFLRLYA